MKQKSCRSESGFTLPETLVASIILLVGVMGIISIFPQSMRGTKDAGKISVLNHLAAEKIEQLRATDYATADLAVGTHPAQSSDGNGGYYYAVTDFSSDYSLRWIVSTGPTDQTGNPVANIKTVTIEATYDVRYTLAGTPVKGDAALSVAFRSFVTN